MADWIARLTLPSEPGVIVCDRDLHWSAEDGMDPAMVELARTIATWPDYAYHGPADGEPGYSTASAVGKYLGANVELAPLGPSKEGVVY